MNTVDFNKLVLPNVIQEGNENAQQSMLQQFNLLLCPIEYKEQLQLRLINFGKVQQKIKNANISSEKEKQLHVAIQGYFREWFVQSNKYKEITDMVKMID